MTVRVEDAEENLSSLLVQAAQSHEPITIAGPDSTGILVSEEDWQAIQETLHLLSIPGMRESIRDGLETPVEQCSEDPGW
jgi:PHD/YefM family antitoxin component YafN of YafNO toxin-antitoxin module